MSTVDTIMPNATHTYESTVGFYFLRYFAGPGHRKLGKTIDSGAHTATKLRETRTLYHFENYIYFKSRTSDGKFWRYETRV